MNFKKLMSIAMGAAIVGSIMPVSSVEAAIKLEALEGTINEAKAFMGGRYVFDGYKGEDQDNGIYYFNGEKDVEIEDAETMGSKYGMNYINFKEDEVLFNLATGQVEEDDEETKVAIMENKFRTVMRKARRYDGLGTLINKGKISEDVFSGVWYEYLVTNEGLSEKYTVYLSDTGKYVDASETLNMVYYDENGDKLTIDTYDDLEENHLSVVFEKALMLDQENIYKLLLIKNDSQSEKTYENEVNEASISTDDSLIGILKYFQSKIKYGEIVPYIQKISMEQGEKEDGAYIPKSVVTCEAYDFDVIDFLINNIKGNNTARISGNNLYTIETNDDKDSITMKKYTMKKIKDKKIFDGKEKTLDKRVLELDESFDYIEDEDMQDYDVDVQGNIWILNKGKIQKFENGKLETKYTVDRSIDNISVFAENSLIAWSTENEIYSVVSPQPVIEEKPEASEEGTESKEEVEIINGWIKNTDGTWSYTNSDGTKAVGWLKDNNTWYYLNAEGVMQTGWIKDGSTWYYLNSSGAMQTGWVKDGEQWYYLNASGAMHTGWLKDTNGKWYYLYDNGVMAHSTVIDGYKLDASGAWIN